MKFKILILLNLLCANSFCESFNIEKIDSFSIYLFQDLDSHFGKGDVIISYSNGQIGPPVFTWKNRVTHDGITYLVSVQIQSAVTDDPLVYDLGDAEFYFRDIVSSEILRDGRKRTKIGDIHIRFSSDRWKKIISKFKSYKKENLESEMLMNEILKLDN